MTTSSSPWMARACWLLAGLLVAWNILAATLANPFTLLAGYDGSSYQLLARNRLAGHTAVNDVTHTVLGTEGAHPMWRPGLVWVEEMLARVFGSVQAGSAAASALGTIFLEMSLFLTAWRRFGPGTALALLSMLLLPFTLSVHFLCLPVRQCPEVWAGALLVLGLCLLAEARDKQSWLLAIAAGITAGLAEWFRTGNLFLFAVPIAIYVLFDCKRRSWRECGPMLTSLLAFAATMNVGDRLVPSTANKTVANLWAILVEDQGRKIVQDYPQGPVIFCLGGLDLAPGTQETYYDHFVNEGRQSTRAFFREHQDEILSLYFNKLGEVVAGGASGLRSMTGEWILLLFLVQVIWCLARPGPATLVTLAWAAAFLAQFLGPIVLLRGDDPTHYYYVALPLILLLSAAGAVQIAGLAGRLLVMWKVPETAFPRIGVSLGIILFVSISIPYYHMAYFNFKETKAQADGELEALDRLALEGKQVACRNMSWFIDRDIQARLLPFATVPELEKYVRTHNLDGILLWENEPAKFFHTNPYGMLPELDQALRQSDFFGPPQVAGAWRFYPWRSGKY